MNGVSSLSTLRDGLGIGQRGLDVLSSQVTNQEPLGTKKELYLSTDTLGNPVTKGVISTVNEGTVNNLKSSAGKDGSLSVQNDSLKHIATLIGNKDGDNLAVQWGKIQGTIGKITANSATSSALVTQLEGFSEKLNESERVLQSYRQTADQGISSSIVRVNEILQEIHTINHNLERLKTGETTLQESTLQDHRRSLLIELNGHMNFQSSIVSNSVVIQAPNGLPLLDDQVHPLQFTASPITITAGMTKAGGGLGGVLTDTGVDITGLITSGKIHGNLQIRDVTAPKYSTHLSDFTKEVYTRVNAEFNKGTPFPPPTTLTGTSSYDEAANVTITGTVHVTVLDGSGNYVGRVTFSDETITLGTLRDRISAHGDLNATLAAGGNPLVITGQNNRHVAVGGTGTIELQADPTTQTNFSHFFGFHNAFSLPTGITLATEGLGGHIRVSTSFKNGQVPLGSIDTTLTSGNVIGQNKMDVALTLAKEFGDHGTVFSMGNPPATKNLKNHLLDFLSGLVEESKTTLSQAKSAEETHFQTRQMFQRESGVNVEESILDVQKWIDYMAQISKLIQTMHESNSRVLDTISAALSR